MSMTNFIQFDKDDIDNAKGTGLISTIDRDLDIKVRGGDGGGVAEAVPCSRSRA
ncbi:hypothetical protein [Pseudorhizobium banfieldiae]|uniref:hypothetical protein n=1 Tax=Pseudorhizobium banfieldiae TaxID=1125847 RepID=UPI000A9138D5|nr:hypothetical protein [Pseudorhizobium banfieldiae]CAD6631208.1 hypothetical protein RNT25_04585 [arsenite-oxidising bacterium NT-25]